MSRTEIRHSPSPPNQLDRNEIHIQHAPDSAHIEGIWAGSKVDEAKCVIPHKVTHVADGEDHTILPEERYVGMDTNASTAQATLPNPDNINDGHIVTIDDEGGNAGTNNITVATPGSETVEGSATGTISTNDATTDYMWDAANTNWVNVS